MVGVWGVKSDRIRVRLKEVERAFAEYALTLPRIDGYPKEFVLQ